MISAALLCLQLVNSTNPELDAYQRRITPEVRVVRKVAPTVVYITTEGVHPVRDMWGRVWEQKRSGSGSGVVIHEDGYIVTNYHVVRTASENGISVTFDPAYGDGKTYSAQLISAEEQEDLALLKIEGEHPFEAIVLGTSSDLMIAEPVLAIGNPYGQTHTVSRGIISGLHRQVDVSKTQRFSELIQTDAAINPGNSGGPLVNINGELIGINTVMNIQAQNIGFAIPVDGIRQVLQEKLLSPSLARAWLGFDVDLETLRVERVLNGSPAALAGLERGDKVLRIGERTVSNEEEYRFARVELTSDAEVEVEVLRKGRNQRFQMKSWNRLRGLLFKRLGLEVANHTLRVGYRLYRVLRVAAVRDSGPADNLGIQVGDVFYAVSAAKRRPSPIQTEADLALLINDLDPGTTIELDIWRDLDKDGIFDRGSTESELFQGPLSLE